MFELLLAAGSKQYYPWSGPGSKKLVAGTREAGYFGEVTDAELFDAKYLSAVSPKMTGIYFGVTGGWWKFILDSRIIYVAKNSVMYNVSWAMLYDAGLMYGVKGPGPTPVPLNGAVDQFTYLTKLEKVDGKEKLWPLKGQTLSGANAFVTTTNDYPTDLSEWDRLLIPVSDGRFDNGNIPTSIYNPIQERSGDGLTVGTRGYGGVTGKGSQGQASTSSVVRWRPTLELITDPSIALPLANVFLAQGGLPLNMPVVSFSGPAQPVKAVRDVVAVNSHLVPLRFSISTTVPTVVGNAPGNKRSLTATLSNDAPLIALRDVKLRNTALAYPQNAIRNAIPEVFGNTNPVADRRLAATLANENTIQGVTKVQAVRTTLLSPRITLKVIAPTVSWSRQSTQRAPDVTFTVTEAQDLATAFSNNKLDGFVI